MAQKSTQERMRRQALLGLYQTKGEMGNEAALRASSRLRTPGLGRSRAGCPQVPARLPSAPTQPQPAGAQRQGQPRALAAAPPPACGSVPPGALSSAARTCESPGVLPRANGDCLPELEGTGMLWTGPKPVAGRQGGRTVSLGLPRGPA